VTLSMKEFRQLKAFMARTTSESDAEALTSLRKANAVLAAHGLTWEQVFSRVVSVVNEFEEAPEDDPGVDAKRTKARIAAAFEDVEASDPKGGFADFIDDIKRQFERTGHLSPAQQDSLFKAANRANERKR